MKYILFCGGGSAGHVVPNLALMHRLQYSYKLAYMGTGGIEQRLVGDAAPFFRVDCPKLVRSFTFENFKIPHRLRKAKLLAKEILERERPDLVFSKGGFASYPAVWAAHKLHIPVLTHESDLSPGLCTRLIAKKCERVLTAFPETAKKFKNGLHVGSPIRKEIFTGDRMRAMHKYSFSGNKPVLLVLGGGSGSRAINEAIRARLPELLKTFDILHLCGKGNAAENVPAQYVQREYETDMASAYACCDIVLSRAGSNTLFELLALKKPALLVPLMRSSRGDQLENAQYFLSRGLCRMLPESMLDTLPAALSDTLSDEALRANLQASDIVSGTPAIVQLIAAFSQSGASVKPSPKISACK